MPSGTPGLPSTILGKIEFFEQRLADWTANAGDIGLTAQQANDLAGRLAAARAKYNTVQQLRQQAKNATTEQGEAVDELARYGADLIAIVRAFADVQADPAAIYTAAELDMPKPNTTPLPPPVPATDVTPTLLTSGAVRVSWKGTTANGTFYDVYRELDSGNGFTLIGSSATRRFDDLAVPAGTTRATYYCVARRDAFASEPSIPGLIRFGMQVQPGSNQLGLAA